MDLKKLLNEQQYEAATTINGPLLILAGAGSGKTRVLTYRIAHMIEDLDIYPSQILAITFTNKAAGEMRDRIRALIGDEVNNMWISTFHSSCVRILRREIDKLGYNKNFTIYDSYDQKTLVKQCMNELNINDKDITDREIINKISDCKNNLISAEEYKKENEKNFRKNKIADAYLLYQKKLKANNALDFDDLIYNTVVLFRKNQDVLEFYQRKFKYIMVDEYQDTNECQYQMVKMLAQANKNIFVVGDDDQCLPEGTLIETNNGNVKIEELKEGNKILSAAGNGEVSEGTIDKIGKRQYTGPLVKVTTVKGKSIKATPNHITFARVKDDLEGYYVYLMYKKGLGFRIGQTQAVRSRKGQKVSGLAVRLNGEQADKIWIIRICKDKGEAAYYEQYYSVKYGLPTSVFTARGRRISMNQNLINKLFNEIDSYENAERLMMDEFLYKEYPHHYANAVVRGDSVRKIVNLSYFGGDKAESRQYYSHRIALITSGEEERDKAAEAGFPVRKEKESGWRIETERVSYDEAEKYGKSIVQLDGDLEIVRKAKLTKEKNFYFMPIGSLKPGMNIAIYGDNNEIIEDTVKEIQIEEYDGFVYDISVPDFRQYISNGMLVHNCIYEWRGANIRNILDFEKDFENTKVIKLEQNYRSKGAILKAANMVIKNNVQRKDKTLKTDKEEGEKIKVYRAYSDQEEASFAINEMKRLIKEEGRQYKDFAVLYRMNAQSRRFEEAFRKNDIPYRIIGGLKFYDRKEIKDIMAYLKLICNPLDDVSLQRIINEPKRSIGKTTVSKVIDFANQTESCMFNTLIDAGFIPGLSARSIGSINKFTNLINEFIDAKEELTVSEMINKIIDETGYMKQLEKDKDTESLSRIENLKELVSEAVEFEINSEDKSVDAFLENKTLATDMDNYDVDADAAVMMTIHSAKGLEFPVVFMVGMENGIFPSEVTLNSYTEMEEARRLCYVAITRAEEKLYMTSAQQRMVYGRTVCYPPSDFIDEISPDLKEFANKQFNRGINILKRSTMNKGANPYTAADLSGNNNSWNSVDTQKTTSANLTKDEAVPGRKVRHNKFGIGTIINSSNSGSDIILTIAFDNNGIKKLMLDKAPLEAL